MLEIEIWMNQHIQTIVKGLEDPILFVIVNLKISYVDFSLNSMKHQNWFPNLFLKLKKGL